MKSSLQQDIMVKKLKKDSDNQSFNNIQNNIGFTGNGYKRSAHKNFLRDILFQ